MNSRSSSSSPLRLPPVPFSRMAVASRKYKSVLHVRLHHQRGPLKLPAFAPSPLRKSFVTAIQFAALTKRKSQASLARTVLLPIIGSPEAYVFSIYIFLLCLFVWFHLVPAFAALHTQITKKQTKKNPCAQHSRLPVLPSGAALLLIPARILWDNLFEVCRKQTNDPLRPLHPATAPRPTKSPSRQDEKWHQSPTRRATRRDETKRNKREIRIKRAQEQNKRKNCTGTEREHTGLNKSVLRSAETDYLIPWALSLPCAVVPRSVPFAGGRPERHFVISLPRPDAPWLRALPNNRRRSFW